MIGKKEIDEYEAKLTTLRATIDAKDAEIARLENSIGAEAVAAADDRADAAEARGRIRNES